MITPNKPFTPGSELLKRPMTLRSISWHVVVFCLLVWVGVSIALSKAGLLGCSKCEGGYAGKGPCEPSEIDALPDTDLSVVRIASNPSFLYAYLDQDTGAGQVGDPAVRALKPGLTAVWMDKLQQCCADGGHVIDVGSNYGYFSMLSGAMGCSFSAFEPVPTFRSVFDLNRRINALEDKGTVYPIALGHKENNVTIVIPATGGLGSAKVIKRGDTPPPGTGTLAAFMTTLDNIINTQAMPICALKIDAEGYEPYVFAGAKNLIDSGVVEHVVMNFDPPVVKNNGYAMDALVKMVQMRYTGYQLDNSAVYSTSKPKDIKVEALLTKEVKFSGGDLKNMYLYVRSLTQTTLWFEKKKTMR